MVIIHTTVQCTLLDFRQSILQLYKQDLPFTLTCFKKPFNRDIAGTLLHYQIFADLVWTLAMLHLRFTNKGKPLSPTHVESQETKKFSFLKVRMHSSSQSRCGGFCVCLDKVSQFFKNASV